MNTPAWIRCDMCDDYLCTIHEGEHVSDCACPPLDYWDVDPYEFNTPYPGDWTHDDEEL